MSCWVILHVTSRYNGNNKKNFRRCPSLVFLPVSATGSTAFFFRFKKLLYLKKEGVTGTRSSKADNDSGWSTSCQSLQPVGKWLKMNWCGSGMK